MKSTLDTLYRFGLKMFFEPGTEPKPTAFIPICHRWIRDRAFDDVLIDVADYTHLADGPSVLLIGHAGNLVLDFADKRAGLLYTLKRPSSAPFESRVLSAARRLLGACQLLEDDQALDPTARFRGDEMQFVSNDRLVAPSDDATAKDLRERLKPVLATLYPGMSPEVSRPSSAGKDRLKLTVAVSPEVRVATLLSKIL